MSKTEKIVLHQIVNHFTTHDLITIEEAKLITNKKEANLRKYFRTFMNLGIVIPDGNNKGRKYRINKEIVNNKR